MKIKLLILIIVSFTSCKPLAMENIELPYKKGNSYVFSYTYFSINNEKTHFIFKAPFYNTSESDFRDNWSINNKNSNINTVSDRIISFIKLSIQEGSVNEGQTAITYHYLDNSYSEVMQELTGIIQDSSRVWFHPPRTRAFEILEFNPFPEIKFPLEINNKWERELQVGDHWSNKRTFYFEGSLKIKTKFEIVDKVKLETNFGVLECYKIFAQSQNIFGTSELISYYNEKYGFVKLEFLNMNKSKIILNLEEIQD